MKSIKRVNLFFLIVMVLQIIGPIVEGLVLHGFKINVEGIYRDPKSLLILIGTNQILFLLVPVIIYITSTKQNIKRVLKLNKIRTYDIGLTVLMTVLFLPTMLFLNAITSLFVKNNVAQMLSTTSQLPLIYSVIVIALFPAFFEEFIMRGLILHEYRGVTIKKAAIMNGIFFGMLHLNISQTFYAFAMGVLATYLVYYTKSIFASMVFHFSVNGINVVVAWVTQNYFLTSNNEALNQAESITTVMYIVTYGILFIIAALTLWGALTVLKLIKNRNVDRWQVSESYANEIINTENVYYDLFQNRESIKTERIISPILILTFVIYLAVMVFDYISK